MGEQLRFLTPTWSEIEELCMDIAEEIAGDGYEPDVVVGVLRGGVVPAKLVADYLGVERMAVMEVKFYAGIGVRREEPVVTQPLTERLAGLRVLIVDDVADTGKTLAHVVNYVSLYGPAEVRTATLYVKPWARVRPDYYGEETDAWIIFPWEKMETVRELVGRGFTPREAAEVAGLDPWRAEELLRVHRGDE